MPPAATKSIYGKISKSQILTPPHPQGQVMSVKSEQPLDELTVQVWLLHDHPNLKYCTLNVSGTELRTDGRTDGQTDGRTDDPNTRSPRRTFQAGGIETSLNISMFKLQYYVWVVSSSEPDSWQESYSFIKGTTVLLFQWIETYPEKMAGAPHHARNEPW